MANQTVNFVVLGGLILLLLIGAGSVFLLDSSSEEEERTPISNSDMVNGEEEEPLTLPPIPLDEKVTMEDEVLPPLTAKPVVEESAPVWQPPTQATKPLPIEKPAFPTIHTATIVGNTIVLGWNDNSYNEDGFEIRRASGDGWSTIGTVGPNITTFTDTRPVHNGYNNYIVRAFNALGNASSGTRVITGPTGPQPPPPGY